MRRITAGIIVTAALALGGAQAAHAEEYPPTNPATPTLGGTTAVGTCIANAPYISFTIELIDPSGSVTTDAATMTLNGPGGQTYTIALGNLGPDGTLSGQVLWPGASVDASGAANGWPGWEFVNGEWVETTGNFAWTRQVSSATIEVNPEVDVALSYPPATPLCTDPPNSPSTVSGSTSSDALPTTGVAAWTLPLGIGAGIAVLAGLGLALVRRRRTNAE